MLLDAYNISHKLIRQKHQTFPHLFCLGYFVKKFPITEFVEHAEDCVKYLITAEFLKK